jgi:hypothetical protein
VTRVALAVLGRVGGSGAIAQHVQAVGQRLVAVEVAIFQVVILGLLDQCISFCFEREQQVGWLPIVIVVVSFYCKQIYAVSSTALYLRHPKEKA